jgi:predicted ester cyclase
MRAFLAWLFGVFPDIRYDVDDIITEGDKIAVRTHATASQQGEYLGFTGTGTRVSYTEMFMFRVADGQIAEWWIEADRLSTLEQIGAIASPPG